MKRTIPLLLALSLGVSSWPMVAQEAPAPESVPAPAADPDWLSWTPKNVHDQDVDLKGFENKTIYVLVFAPNSDKACAAMRAVAAFVREHPNKAGKVLALCTDPTGAAAIRLYLRQEEYPRRVAAWTAEQDAAEAAAKAANQPFTRPAMPDFAQAIEDELATEAGRNALMAHHLPFTTCQRHEAMWTWLLGKVTTPESVPRLLKFNPQGSLLNEWDCLPDPNPLASND